MQIYKKIVTQQPYPTRINLNLSIIFSEDTYDDEQIADQTQHWCNNDSPEREDTGIKSLLCASWT